MKTATTTPKKLSNNEKATNRVAKAIAAKHILAAYSPTLCQSLSIGTYNQAVDIGNRFAILGGGSRYTRNVPVELVFKTAEEAAHCFVSLVGSTRAREVAIKRGF